MFDLKSVLVPEDRDLPRPLTFNQQSGYRLKEGCNTLQDELNKFLDFSNDKKMVINDKKIPRDDI